MLSVMLLLVELEKEDNNDFPRDINEFLRCSLSLIVVVVAERLRLISASHAVNPTYPHGYVADRLVASVSRELIPEFKYPLDFRSLLALFRLLVREVTMPGLVVRHAQFRKILADRINVLWSN